MKIEIDIEPINVFGYYLCVEPDNPQATNAGIIRVRVSCNLDGQLFGSEEFVKRAPRPEFLPPIEVDVKHDRGHSPIYLEGTDGFAKIRSLDAEKFDAARVAIESAFRNMLMMHVLRKVKT